MGYANLWELSQRAVRENGAKWLGMLDEGQGPAVVSAQVPLSYLDKLARCCRS